MSRLRLCLLLPLIGLIGACSQVQFAYDNADWLIYRWASRLVDASADQRDAWRPWFGTLLETHRAQLLPEVVGLLQELERTEDRGLSEHSLTCLLDATDDLYRQHARLAVPLATRVLGEISPGQVDHLAQALEERNREYVDEYLADDRDARAESRLMRYLDRIERWTGRLTRDQRRRVTDAIARIPDTTALWFDYRRQQQDALIALLREQPRDMQGVEAFLRAWWVDFDGSDDRLVNDIAEARRQWIRLIVELDAMVAPEQRQAFATRVANLRSDLADAGRLNRQAARVFPGPVCA